MVLTHSFYALEGFGMILLSLLVRVSSPWPVTWPVTTIHRPTAWPCQWILAKHVISLTHL